MPNLNPTTPTAAADSHPTHCHDSLGMTEGDPVTARGCQELCTRSKLLILPSCSNSHLTQAPCPSRHGHRCQSTHIPPGGILVLLEPAGLSSVLWSHR